MKYNPTLECFHAGKETKIACAISGEYGGCSNTVASEVPLAQGPSDVQGRYRVATANSSYAKAQYAYDVLNSVSDQVSLVAGSVYSCTIWDEFHVNNYI